MSRAPRCSWPACRPAPRWKSSRSSPRVASCDTIDRESDEEESQEVRMLTLTETATKKIADLRLEEGKPEWGLRVRIVGGGCSGMSYELGWEDEPGSDDDVIETQGVKVFVDKYS